MGARFASHPVAALSLAAIPSNINTYERLLIWAAQCCQSIANGQQVNAVEGVGSVPLAQVQVAVTADNADRFVVSAYIPMDRNQLNSPDEKTWMAAKDIAATAPHSNLLSN
jgi:hypothetical protein